MLTLPVENFLKKVSATPSKTLTPYEGDASGWLPP